MEDIPNDLHTLLGDRTGPHKLSREGSVLELVVSMRDY